MNSQELIHRYLLGIASEDDVRQLERLLQNDPTVQDEFLLQAEMDAHLRQEAQSAGVPDMAEAPARRNPMANDASIQPRRRTRFAWAAFSAASLLVALLWLLTSQDSAPDPLIHITSINGPLMWTGNGGQITQTLAVGDSLTGGSIELLAPDSWVEFAFEDQSTVSLTGLTAVTITDSAHGTTATKRKEMHLKHGRLCANVRQQPSDSPLLIRTPSAELTVLGTQFDVETESESTRLTVNQGRVRLKRLTDGSEIDVPASQTILASLQDQDGLTPSARQTPVTVWQSDLRNDVVHGKWFSDLSVLAKQLKIAVAEGDLSMEAARAAFKKAATFDDSAGSLWATPTTYGSLVVLSPQRSVTQPVLLTASTSVRVRGRCHANVPLTIGLSTGFTDGGFAGKYRAEIPAASLTVGEAFEVELPLHEFVDTKQRTHLPIGYELKDWWCIAENASVKIEITNVELTKTPAKETP